MRQTSPALLVAFLLALYCPGAIADSINVGSLSSASEPPVVVSLGLHPTLAPVDLDDVFLNPTRSGVSALRVSNKFFLAQASLSPDFNSSLTAPPDSFEAPGRASTLAALDDSSATTLHFDHQFRAPGFTNCTPIPVSPAPEPSTIALFASGLLGLGLKRVLG